MSRSFLLFQLYGALASWGDIAVGDMRPTFDRPSKSAVIGLIAAALGIERPHQEMDAAEQRALEEKHRALASSLGYAVRIDRAGVFLRDYHTVQSPDDTKGHNHLSTRRDEVLFEELGSKETYREYYSSMLATVCLWEVGDAPYPLAAIRAKLRRPRFTPYLGRKACPPALPFNPVIVEAKDIRAAFANADVMEHLSRFGNHGEELCDTEKASYYWEGDPDEGFGEPQQIVMRRDAPGSRTRWQFGTRREFVARMPRQESFAAD